MEHFGDSSRRLIVRSLSLAQECGAELLMPDHILASIEDNESLAQLRMQARRNLARGPASPTPPEFSPQVLQIFEKAFRIALGPIEELHLLMSMPLWGVGSRVLFNEGVLARLEHLGVDIRQLQQLLEGRDLLSHLPKPGFWGTPAGKQVADLAAGCTDAGAYIMLFGLILVEGPVSESLGGCGLTEPVLIAILTNFSENSVERLLASAELGPAGNGLTRAAQVALVVGWNCAKREPLGTQNLLDGVLCADILCQPGKGATRILRKLGVLGFAHSATRDMVAEYPGGGRDLSLSIEVEGALDAARKIAGEGPVGTQHLLYGLSEVGLKELRALLIVPDWVRENLEPAD